MARIVKDYGERHAEFLDAAQHLFFEQGYDQTTVRQIIDEVGVAKGTFYHYFDSKQDILEPLVARLYTERLALFDAIVSDETLGADEKMAQAFRVIGDWHVERKAELLALARVMLSEENLLLSRRLHKQEAEHTLPLVTEIIAQGVEEGIFNTAYVEETAGVLYAVSRAMSDSVIDVLLNSADYDDPEALVRRRVAAGQSAIEQVLGAAPGSLVLISEQMVAGWFQDDVAKG